MSPSDERSEDRRHAVRRKSLKGAEVVFNNRNSVISGLVRNLSEAGAKFVVDSPVDLPKEIHLRLPFGKEHKAEIIWQKGKTEFGLRFIETSNR
jgi:hypothetical protein